ncbi:MAG: hypothetical protein ACOVRK_14915 [Chryseobacterium taeanense]
MNKDKLTSLLFFIIGIILLFPSIFLTFRSITIISSYETAQGKLVDFTEKWKKNKDTEEEYVLYAPVFEYRDNIGKTYKINSREYSNNKTLGTITQKIYYKKDHPEIAITGIFQLYIVPFISVFFCFVCFITAYICRKPAVI